MWDRRHPGTPLTSRIPHTRLALHAMGCRWEILLPGDDAVSLRAAGQEALREIERLDARLSAFEPTSTLSGLNARAPFGWVQVDGEIFYLLSLCRELWGATEGAFDVTVGPLLRCWGFRGGRDDLPTEEEVAAARAATGMAHVELDPERCAVRFARPGIALDPGAIGKGYALDRAAEILRDLGVRSALLHAGTSSILALGSPPDADAWPIAIAHPTDPGRHLAVKHLRDTGLAVSGSHGRVLRLGGHDYGHVVDPATGRPAEGHLLAGVVYPSATVADALSTALLVRGETLVPALKARWPEVEAQIAGQEDGK